jgi:hypothetical protein
LHHYKCFFLCFFLNNILARGRLRVFVHFLMLLLQSTLLLESWMILIRRVCVSFLDGIWSILCLFVSYGLWLSSGLGWLLVDDLVLGHLNVILVFIIVLTWLNGKALIIAIFVVISDRLLFLNFNMLLLFLFPEGRCSAIMVKF